MTIFIGKQNKPHNGSAFYQYLSTATVNLMLVCCGMHYVWLPLSSEKLQLEDSPIFIMMMMEIFGSILGLTIVNITVHFLGRKRTILLCGPFYVLTWLLIFFAESVEILYAARFVAGCFNILLNVTSLIYISEISEPRIRGFLVSSLTVTWTCGILLINHIGSYLSISATALVSAVVPAISVLSFYWMPESPYGLLMKDNYEGAKQSLKVLRGLKDVDSELDRINNAINSQKPTSTGKFFDLFRVKSNKKAVIISLLLRSAQLFTGSAGIIFYTQIILGEAGGSVPPAMACITYVWLQLIVGTFASSIVDKTGRRPLLIISITGSALALFIEGTYFLLNSQTNITIEHYSYISLCTLLAYVIAFNCGMLTVPSIVIGELFPANVKVFVVCFVDLYLSISTITSYFFQIMKDNYGMYVPFYALTGISLIYLVCIYRIVPETKGQTLEDIQYNLSRPTIKK